LTEQEDIVAPDSSTSATLSSTARVGKLLDQSVVGVTADNPRAALSTRTCDDLTDDRSSRTYGLLVNLEGARDWQSVLQSNGVD
jgi:hypothetical protein